ncbi:MAG: hypothetical protein IV093_21915 [Rubrivivax sp.]|nr:hypothetical protein [Rubrivivax sp.]
MQAWYPAGFDREYGCTEAEWLGWLPAAIGEPSWHSPAPGCAEVELASGRLALSWTPLPLRRIALVALPRLAVAFRFGSVDEAERQAFMKRFDLYMQRGGG